MNELNQVKVFDCYDKQAIADYEISKKKYDGFVYVVEVGNSVKIGCTSHLVKRMLQLDSMFKNYAGQKMGRIAVTTPHMNYVENERAMHKLFSNSRMNGGEMFDEKFIIVSVALSSLRFETSDDIRAKKEQGIEEAFEKLKYILMNQNCNTKHSKTSNDYHVLHEKQVFEYRINYNNKTGRNAGVFLLQFIDLLRTKYTLESSRDEEVDLALNIALYDKCDMNVTISFNCEGLSVFEDDNTEIGEDEST